MKACSYEPEDRYQTIHELIVVLKRFIEGIQPSDRRRKRREPDQVFFRRSKRNAMIAVGIMPFAVGALCLLLQNFTSSRRTDDAPTVVQSANAPLKKSAANFLKS